MRTVGDKSLRPVDDIVPFPSMHGVVATAITSVLRLAAPSCIKNAKCFPLANGTRYFFFCSSLPKEQ